MARAGHSMCRACNGCSRMWPPPKPGRRALHLDADRHLDPFVAADPLEIDVQDAHAEVIVLHFLDDGGLRPGRQLQIDDPGIVPQGGFRFLCGPGQRERRLPCGRKRRPGSARPGGASWHAREPWPGRGLVASLTDSIAVDCPGSPTKRRTSRRGTGGSGPISGAKGNYAIFGRMRQGEGINGSVQGHVARDT